MEWVFIGLGVTAFFVLAWYLHRRFGGEPTQTHSNVKPLETHDPEPLIAQGLDSLGRGK